MTGRSDDLVTAIVRRTSVGGHGCADPDAPQPVLDLADPELVAAYAEFNAGVERARDEYAAYPITAYGSNDKPRWGIRVCPECGDYHKSKANALCWRCIPARTKP